MNKIQELDKQIDEMFIVLKDCRSTLILLSLIDNSSLSKKTLEEVEGIIDKYINLKK